MHKDYAWALVSIDVGCMIFMHGHWLIFMQGV